MSKCTCTCMYMCVWGYIGDVYGCGLSYPINLCNEFTTMYTFMGVSLTIMGGLTTEVMNNVSQLILMND